MLFAEQVACDFVVELAVEPGDEAPHLDPFSRAATEERRVGVGFLEVFADYAGIRNDQSTVFNERRDGAGGVEFQVFGPSFPHLFQPEFEGKAFLGQYEPDFSCERRERQVVESTHRRNLSHRVSRRAKPIDGVITDVSEASLK